MATTKKKAQPARPHSDDMFVSPESLPMEEEFYSGEPDDLDESELPTETMADFKDVFLKEVQAINNGSLLRGHIIKICDNEVYVDINFKTEGVVPLGEFTDDRKPPNAGDAVEVLVIKMDENDGSITLSRNKARLLKAWDLADQAFQAEGLIEAKVVAKVKGGLSADFHGLKAFIPGSLMSLQQEYDLEKYIGQIFDFKIIEFNRRRRNMVLSRKAILEKERKRVVGELLLRLQPGQVVEGQVKNVTDYGAFVSLEDGRIDGLLHKADMSWAHVRDISKFVKVSEKIQVKILNVDRENEKISLGLKQLSHDPWLTIDEKLRVGEIVKGHVKNITHFGAFVEVADGIEGLVHISDMSWTERVRHPKEVCNIDDAVEVKILNIDPDERKIALGMKQVHPDPWSVVADEYSIGEVVTGTVKHLADFGAFVELREGVEGLIHISDLSWVGRVKHPSDVLQPGVEVEVKILDMDTDNKKISLGLKQVNPDPWELAEDSFPAGTIMHGKVKKLTEFGAFVELKDGIEGLVHVSDFSWTERVQAPTEYLQEGQEVDVKILEVNRDERKISLGIKQLTEEPWVAAMRKVTPGMVVEGKVARLAAFGAFVEIDKGVEGLLHVSDLSWTERVAHPQDKLKVGDSLKLKVLEVNEKERKVSLGLKQLENDPVENFLKAHPMGSIVDGEITSTTEFGAFVKIGDGLEGIVPASQIAELRGKPEDLVKKGEKVRVKVLDVERKERRLRLSIRQAKEEEERRAYEDFNKKNQSADGSIGDILGKEMKRKLRDIVKSGDDESKG